MSSSVAAISRIIVIFFIFFLTKAAAGSCLSYGHSCWGGHGKRSGISRQSLIPPLAHKQTNEWYLSKLLKPPYPKANELAALFKTPKQNFRNSDRLTQYEYQVYPITDVVDKSLPSEARGETDSDSEVEEWGPDTSDSETEVVVMTPEEEAAPNSKLRMFQILNQEGVRKQNAG